MKKIFMFKDGRYQKWDGSPVDHLIIKQTMTVSEIKKKYPDAKLRLSKEVK